LEELGLCTAPTLCHGSVDGRQRELSLSLDDRPHTSSGARARLQLTSAFAGLSLHCERTVHSAARNLQC